MAPEENLLRLGGVVETTFGVGVIVERRKPEDGGMVGVRLWRLPGRSLGTASTAYLQPKAILKSLPVAPGMTTMTKEEIPKKVLVHSYSSSQQKYMVSYADEEDAAAVAAIMPHLNRIMNLTQEDSDDEFFDAEEDVEEAPEPVVKAKPVVLLSYTPDQLEPTKAAKFYPLLLELMNRGDEAVAQVEGLWLQNKDNIREVAEKLAKTGEQVGTELASKGQAILKENEINIEDITDIDKNAEQAAIVAESAVETLKTTVQQHKPSQEEVKKVMTMLKDEEFTVLLENGRQRLEQLVQTDLPKATQEVLDGIGIKWKETTGGDEKLNETQQKALDAVEDLLKSVQKAAKAQGIDIPEDKLSLKGLNLKELETQFQELHLEEKFQTMFDSFVDASKSDRHLSSIMEHVAQHTTEWQQMTGRLLATKSGSLFLEGASRIQQRAGMILSGGKGPNVDLQQWSQSMTTKFTKAFTEGDAAVARLKSIELGDAVRQRLVAAIEIRSDSLGGLDGIIARALGAVETSTKKASRSIKKRINQDSISAMLTDLQTSATGKRKDAHETLISVLSSRSVYRDIALLKLERTFCDLETQFFGATWNSEDSWSAEDLAKLARGEGGTAELFEPIAKRAKQEIDHQLDVAEGHVRKQLDAKNGNDKNAELVLEALSRVRKIMSGELTMNAIVEDVVTLLNDDKIVRIGEEWVQRGERMLDAIEGVQNMNGDLEDPTNKLITNAMQIAKKAGITKDSVMKELEKVDVDELLDTAQGAATDEKKRLKILSQATDAALDFFLKILPSMPVPPFDGVKDGLVYHLSNLSMEGFKVKKENIVVEIAGMRATTNDHNKGKALGTAMSMKAVKDAVKNIPPSATAGTALDAPDSNSSLIEEASTGDDSAETNEELDITTTEAIGHVKATELLIIDISDVSAVLDSATWSFEQTYFPYLKGNGKSDVKLAEGSLRLQFELRKRRRKIQVPKAGGAENETEEKEIWEPVLCLHDRSCKIGEVFVTLQGEGKLAWVLNKLSGIFKGPIGTYVARQIVAVMSNKSGFILDKLNTVLSPYWDLILSTAGLKMDDLVEADHRVVTTADSEDKENTIELVWRERLPLGLNLLLNDESGQVKVVDLPRGSQARKVCEARQLDPEIFKGATIVAVNGCRFFEPEEVYDALRDPIRPKTILFELAESEEAQRVEEFVAEAMNEKAQKIKETATGRSPAKAPQEKPEQRERTFKIRSIEITKPGDLGIEFGESPDSFGLMVCGFVKKEDGSSHEAEESGQIFVNDLLTHINGKLVLGENGAGRDKAFEILKSEGSARPLKLEFSDPYLIPQIFDASPTDANANLGGPTELVLEDVEPAEAGSPKRIVLSGFKDTAGVAETSNILIGDYLVFINGKSVGAGSRWLGEEPVPTLEDVYSILRDPKQYPMGLTFARPSQSGDMDNSWKELMKKKSSSPKGTGEQSLINNEEAETVAVSTERLEALGCVFDALEGTNDVVVTDFYAIPGFFQTVLQPIMSPGGRSKNVKLAIESINGQFVPSYASKDIVMNAMKRSWAKTRHLELLFCDDECKTWVHSLVAPGREKSET